MKKLFKKQKKCSHDEWENFTNPIINETFNNEDEINYKNENKKSTIATITYGLLVILILVGVSYAVWNYSFLGSGNDIARDEIVVDFLESSDGFVGVTNSIPISDTEGMAQEETYDFQVSTKTKNGMAIGYKLTLEKLEASPGYTNLDDSMVKVYLTDYDDNVVVPPTLVSDLDNYVLYEHLNSHDEENSLYKDKYKIRIWIDGNVTGEDLGTEENLQYNFEINVDFIEKQTTNNVSDLSVSLLNAKYTYDGTEKTPEVLVKDRSKVLVEGTDYTVTYSNNTNAGVASVVITGKGDYTGTVTKKFIIGKAESVCTISTMPSLEYPKTSAGNVVYSCTGDGEVSLVSSDENLIEVGEITNTNIKITALKNGTGTITLKQAEGANYKKSNEVTKDISVGLSAYTVTYDYKTNGGSSATKTSASVSYGSSIDLTPTATKSGWTFVGWNTNKDATSKLTSLDMGTSNVTLYAIYKKEAITYKATTKSNVESATGTGKEVSCTIDAVYNNATQGTSCQVTLPDNPYTLTNWTFNGWVNGGSNSTTTTTSGTASGNKLTISSNVNIIATWKKSVTVKLTFDKNGGSANTTSNGVTTTLYNGNTSLSATLTFTAPACTTYSGWTCVGYNTSSSSTTSSFDVGSEKDFSVSGTVGISETSYTKASGYYHIWKKTSTATFYYYNGSSQSSKDATCTMYNGGTSCSYTLPSEVSSSSGPSSTTYKGVSTSASSTTTTTSYTSANSKYYAVYTKTLTGTFYYNSNTTSGSLTVSTATASGTRTSTTNGTTYSVSEGSITVPSAVTGSVGKYNSTYKGVSTSLSSMGSSSVTTANTTYYANYSKAVTIYYPTSTSAVSSGTFYRNEYFTSTSATSQVIGSSNTATSNITTISGILGTFKGLASSANTTSYSAVTTSAASSPTTFYAVSTSSVEATFYYNSNATSGSLTVSTTKASGTRTNYCASTSSATVSHGSITVPSAVTGSVGQYNNTYLGLATSLNTMTSSTSATTGNTTYYAVYRSNVTIYRPTSASVASSVTAYRNSYFTSTSAMSTVLSSTNTGTSTMSSVSGIYGTFKGFGSVNTSTVTYSSIDALLKSNITTTYAISTSSITISYNANGGSGAPSNQTTTRTTYCTSTSAATTTGNTTISSTKPTKTGYTFSKWNTSSDGSGTNYSSGTSYNIASSVTLYAIYTINSYTVNVVVQNGTVDTASKTIQYNKSGTFNLTNNEGSDYTSVSCTNSQTASVSGGVLTVSNVTNNTTCTVVYTERTYTVTYAVGSDSTATGLPSSQTKRYTKALTLSSTEPTSSTNEFLGWSKTSTATESDTWYDPSNEYTTNENMTLYAQWYDVDTLEKEITASVRAGDIKLTPAKKLTAVSVGAFSSKGFSPGMTAETGYKLIPYSLPYHNTGASSTNAYAATASAFNVRNGLNSSAATVTPVLASLEVYNRTGEVTTGSLDNRILNMQNISEACLSYKAADGDIKIKSASQTISLTDSANVSSTAVTADSGYTLISIAGYNLAPNTSTTRQFSNVKIRAVWKAQLNIRNASEASHKVNLTTYALQTRTKSVGTLTSPSYDTTNYTKLGIQKLVALKELQTKSASFFTSANCNTASVSITGVTVSEKSYTTKTATMSGHTRFVMPVAFAVTNGSSGSGSSYATPKTMTTTYNTDATSVTATFKVAGNIKTSTWYGPSKCTATIYAFVIDK